MYQKQIPSRNKIKKKIKQKKKLRKGDQDD